MLEEKRARKPIKGIDDRLIPPVEEVYFWQEILEGAFLRRRRLWGLMLCSKKLRKYLLRLMAERAVNVIKINKELTEQWKSQK